jgi:hypothetical protein
MRGGSGDLEQLQWKGINSIGKGEKGTARDDGFCAALHPLGDTDHRARIARDAFKGSTPPWKCLAVIDIVEGMIRNDVGNAMLSLEPLGDPAVDATMMSVNDIGAPRMK